MSFLWYEICVDVCACKHSWVGVYVSAFVFMLQWGVKLIWEAELLNLLLKLVFDRKLISKAREEEVEEGEKKERRKEMKVGSVSFASVASALTSLFRLNLFPLDEPWHFHPGNRNLLFWRRANQEAIFNTVVVARQLFFIFLSLLESEWTPYWSTMFWIKLICIIQKHRSCLFYWSYNNERGIVIYCWCFIQY